MRGFLGIFFFTFQKLYLLKKFGNKGFSQIFSQKKGGNRLVFKEKFKAYKRKKQRGKTPTGGGWEAQFFFAPQRLGETEGEGILGSIFFFHRFFFFRCCPTFLFEGKSFPKIGWFQKVWAKIKLYGEKQRLIIKNIAFFLGTRAIRV